MRSIAPLLLILASLAACNEKQKHCEHARDVYVSNAERAMKDALANVAPGDRARLERIGKADIEKAKAGFEAHCLALYDDNKECIAKIDELEKADVDKRAAIEACPKDEDGFPDAACAAKATAEQQKIVGRCEDVIATIVAKIYGNAKPSEPDVIDLENVPQ